jgi:hypothetical protein
MWQGLRGEDLEVNTAGETSIRCARTGQVVVFSSYLPDEEQRLEDD